MILGVGVDIVQIPRIKLLVEKYGAQFLERILSSEEIDHYHHIERANDQHISFLAKRFAAKEAVSKALGTGIGNPLRFTDISIISDDLGKPAVRMNGGREDVIIHLSLSDDYPVAIAFAVATLKLNIGIDNESR